MTGFSLYSRGAGFRSHDIRFTNRGYRIPTLDELLQYTRGTELVYHIVFISRLVVPVVSCSERPVQARNA